MTNETQDVRIILDPFLEHPKLGLLLAECQCPQSNFRTGHLHEGVLSLVRVPTLLRGTYLGE